VWLFGVSQVVGELIVQCDIISGHGTFLMDFCITSPLKTL